MHGYAVELSEDRLPTAAASPAPQPSPEAVAAAQDLPAILSRGHVSEAYLDMVAEDYLREERQRSKG